MGIQFLNGVPYGTTRQIRELTQAEYDALPSSKYTDGILYCITDDGMVEGNKFAPIIYSTEEREIGTWIDGKPLYQKTWDFSSSPKTLTRNAWTRTGISNTGIASVINVFAVNDVGDGFRMLAGSKGSYDDIEILNSLTSRDISASYVTLQYTKTTDIPGSGKWSTYGVPNHHYNTNEHIIGTWIDGKPIYEKTLHVTSIVDNDTWQNIENLSVKLLIDFECIAYKSSGESGDPTSFRSDRNTPQIQAVSSTGYIRYALISGTSISGLYITARYTKTTD